MFSFIVWICIAYSLVLVAAVIAEPRLIYPNRGKRDVTLAPNDSNMKLLSLTTSDNIRIRGLFYRPAEADGTILYCHGNGVWLNRVETFIANLGDRMRVNVLAFDYRGYGESEGSPNECGLIKDGLAAYDFLIAQSILPAHIILYGRSLGGAVAAQLAAHQPVGGLVLENTFSSMLDVAKYHYRWLPIDWILRNRFDSASSLKKFRGPLLQSHGSADRLVPAEFAQRLFNSAATPNHLKHFLLAEEGGHNDSWTVEFDEEFESFVDRILGRNP
jgi:hypothetical protein